MPPRPELPVKLYYRIGEVAEVVGVEPHVLRYWESEFGSIRPQKSPKGQRVYSRRDLEKLLRVKELLYDEGYTIAGAKKRLREGPAAGRRTGASTSPATTGSPATSSAATSAPALEAPAAEAPIVALRDARVFSSESAALGVEASSAAVANNSAASNARLTPTLERASLGEPVGIRASAPTGALPPGALGARAREELSALRELIRAELRAIDERE